MPLCDLNIETLTKKSKQHILQSSSCLYPIPIKVLSTPDNTLLVSSHAYIATSFDNDISVKYDDNKLKLKLKLIDIPKDINVDTTYVLNKIHEEFISFDKYIIEIGINKQIEKIANEAITLNYPIKQLLCSNLSLRYLNSNKNELLIEARSPRIEIIIKDDVIEIEQNCYNTTDLYIRSKTHTDLFQYSGQFNLNDIILILQNYSKIIELKQKHDNKILEFKKQARKKIKQLFNDVTLLRKPTFNGKTFTIIDVKQTPNGPTFITETEQMTGSFGIASGSCGMLICFDEHIDTFTIDGINHKATKNIQFTPDELKQYIDLFMKTVVLKQKLNTL